MRSPPELPEELERVVLGAMARDPDERYPTAGDFLADVTACRSGVQNLAPSEIDPDRTSLELAAVTRPGAGPGSETADTFAAVTTEASEIQAPPRSRRKLVVVLAAVAVAVALGGGGVGLWLAGSGDRGEQATVTEPPETTPPQVTSEPVAHAMAAQPATAEPDSEPVAPSIELRPEPAEPDPEAPPEATPPTPGPVALDGSPHVKPPPRDALRPEAAASSPARPAALSRAEIAQGLSRLESQVQACLARGGSPPQVIRVRVRIDGAGQARYLGASPAPSGSAVVCLRGVIGRARFRATGGAPLEGTHAYRGRGLMSSPFGR